MGWGMPSGRQLLAAAAAAGKHLAVNPVTGKIANWTKLSKIGDAKHWLDQGKCPQCHRGMPKGWFSGYKMHPNCARKLVHHNYPDLAQVRRENSLWDSEGRNKNGLRYRSSSNKHGVKGSRIYPHDGDWHD